MKFALRFSLLVFTLIVLSGSPSSEAEATISREASVNVDLQHVTFNRSAQEIANDCTVALRQARSRVAQVLAHSVESATFTTTMLPLENITADLNDELFVDQFLSSVSSNRVVRAASDECQAQTNVFLSELSMSPEIAVRLAHLERNAEHLGPAQRKVVSLWNAEAQRSGAQLPSVERNKVRALFNRLDALSIAYMANLSDDARTITLKPTQLVGLPSDLIEEWTSTPQGYIVPVNESVVDRFLQNAQDASARQSYAIAYSNRGYPKNLVILKEALATRAQLARLLGYPNWAAYVLADRMAQTPLRVQHFLDDLDAKLQPLARAQIAQLALLKATDLHKPNATLEPWDVIYYHSMLKRRTYDIDDNTLRQYFPVDHTISAVLDIYAHLLGVRFEHVQASQVWDPEVLQYTVRDQVSNHILGTLYLDLYPRPGKYTHFASFPLVPIRALPNGQLRPAIDAIVGNWPRPAPGHPALLSHSDVETFFHEFGHAMATILTTAPYETLSSGFRTDFIEAPSQMLENWVWQPEILRRLSANVKDGRPLPEAFIQHLIATRYVDEAYFTTRQIMYADVDLAYHSADIVPDTTALWAEIQNRVSPIPFIPNTHPEAAFGHIMGGYDAGYYGYLWSKVYAQDMFSAFEHAGLENPLIGARYRQMILEPARLYEPDQEVGAFLGRAMQPAAFYQALGIPVGSLR